MIQSVRLVLVAGSLLAIGLAFGEEHDLAALEKEFERTMSGAQLVGSFTQSDDPDGTPKRDRYTIQEVRKVKDDVWIFKARIEYGGRDLTVPIPLHVKWAGDTPVITLTDLAIPGLGTFTARVLIYRGQYAGTWSGGDHGGHLFGNVVPAEGENGAGSDDDGDDGNADDDDDDGDEDEDDDDAGNEDDASVIAAPPRAPERTVDWPQFRGPQASGVAYGATLPTTWNGETGEGIAWRTAIPGLAHSSPIIHGDRIFLTSARRADGEASLQVGLYGDIESVADEGVHQFTLTCLDKRSGAEIWTSALFVGRPEFPRHTKGSYAASTPVTDGKHVVAFFGSEGLYCYDVDGRRIWSKDVGSFDAGFYLVRDAQWGVATSPVIHDDLLILQCDVLRDSYLVALDVATGDEVWRTQRDDRPTWSTPTVHVGGERAQVICNGFEQIGGYDLRTGEEIWLLQGTCDIPVPTPIVAHDLIFITNAHGGLPPIFAIHEDVEGDLSLDGAESEAAGIAWKNDRGGNYMQTPLVYGAYLYLCNDSGVLSCYEARTGERIYRERLGAGRDGFTASIVAGDGKLYVTSETGAIHVVKAGAEFALLAVNEMGETCMATPALSEGVLYLRTRGHLVAIASTSAS